jgi:hypothetical protein
MLTSFIYSVKILARDKGVLMWAVAFPLVLSTMFYSMFNGLDATYQLDPLPVIVVADANYRNAPNFSALIDELSGVGTEVDDVAGAGTSGAGGDAASGASAGSEASNAAVATSTDDALSITDSDDEPLFATTFVASETKAIEAMADGGYMGYIMVDSDGMPGYWMDARQSSSLDIIVAIKQSIILGVLDRYTQDYELIAGIAATNPMLFADPGFVDSLLEQQTYTHSGTITLNPPSDALRYYYSVLAFTCIMMMSFGLAAVDSWKADTSALGARRALGGQTWVRSLAPTMLAAWALSFACSLVGFAYIRFVFGISFGGKEAACIAVLAVSTLVSNLLGALLGAVPIHSGAKSGMTAFISCFLSVFAGLYGPASQRVGDYVANELPALSTINPVRQVSDAFFSLYYYDGYERYFEILATLVIMAAVFFVASVLVMRKQRYKSL